MASQNLEKGTKVTQGKFIGTIDDIIPMEEAKKRGLSDLKRNGGVIYAIKVTDGKTLYRHNSKVKVVTTKRRTTKK